MLCRVFVIKFEMRTTSLPHPKPNLTRMLQDLDGAWKLLKEALEIQGVLLDTGHSSTATTAKNIIALYRGGLHTHNRRTLGENHPETIATTK